MFRPPDGDETNPGPDETIFGPREDIPKPAPGSNQPTKGAAKAPWQGTVMIKTISAVAAAALVAAALSILPGFAPKVEAGVPQVLAKADRLDIHAVGRDCSQQAWPNFEASCLRGAGSKAVIREARLVTVQRRP
jgi:hypothetical protein